MNDMTSNDDGGSNFKEYRFAKILIYKLDTFENKCSYQKAFCFTNVYIRKHFCFSYTSTAQQQCILSI